MNGAVLRNAISSGEFVLTAEYTPPRGPVGEPARTFASSLKELVHAISASESEDGIRMASLAACSHLISGGAEPILSVLTRDMNRIALQATLLGAASLGVRNVICMSGRHQTLTSSGSAKGVFDLDPVQLVSIAHAMRTDGMLADGQQLDCPVDFTIGTIVNPFSDPMELQVILLERAVAAGADFVVTEPVFNLDRFTRWITTVCDRGIHERSCIIASVMPLTSADEAKRLAATYQSLDITPDVVGRLDSAEDARDEGIAIATETMETLAQTEGVRGVHLLVHEDHELATKILTSAGLSRR